MQKEIIGIVGCYSHDVILMLAKMSSAMGRKVLLLDHNIHHTLGASIPVPGNISVREKVAEYDGLYFSECELSGEMLTAHDLIFIDFGMHDTHGDLVYCTQIFIITDMLPHHIRRLSKLELNKSFVKKILIRDAIFGSLSGEKEMREFFQSFPNRKEFYLPPDKRDVKNRCVCETLHEYNVKNASPEMKEFVCETVRSLCKEIPEKEFWRRLKRQEKGGYD